MQRLLTIPKIVTGWFMHRDDKSKYLLYIEPTLNQKSKNPIEDEWTQLIPKALDESIPGSSTYHNKNDMEGFFRKGGNFRGIHKNCDGEISSSCDYKLKNGFITNSLAPHYLRWFRSCIGRNDWEKLHQLKNWYKNKEII